MLPVYFHRNSVIGIFAHDRLYILDLGKDVCAHPQKLQNFSFRDLRIYANDDTFSVSA